MRGLDEKFRVLAEHDLLRSVSAAMMIAEEVHGYQNRQTYGYGSDGEEHSYIYGHVQKVVELVKGYGSSYEAVAWLHDVLEDVQPEYKWDIRGIITSGLFQSIEVQAIEDMERRRGEVYLTEYIPRLAKSDLTRVVKLADLSVNINECVRRWDEKSASRLDRYLKAVKILTDYQKESK